MILRPDRLNLSVARRCFVHCVGCYAYFGEGEPDLDALLASAQVFVDLGIDRITLSGGDPLTIRGLVDFLAHLRALGVHEIKVDTVGTTFLSPASENGMRRLDALIPLIDYLGIPLDGWSNDSVLLFRTGRDALYDETVALLRAIDALGLPPNVIVNTVAHRGNLHGLRAIRDEVTGHSSVCQWNVFQYTPTDQVTPDVNAHYGLDADAFAAARAALEPGIEWPPVVDFRSVAERLGEYLLVNSDGSVWIPDEHGRTIYLGRMFGRERVILAQWADRVLDLRRHRAARA